MNGRPEHAVSEPERHTIWQRGGVWVLVQFPLIGLAVIGALIGPTMPGPVRRLGRSLGPPIGLLGLVLFVTGGANLGRNLTPFPMPKRGATLVKIGVYAVVRHPIYGGGVLITLGWALVRGRWAGLLLALIVGAFFDAKATREERWLTKWFPEYPAYRRQTRKLVPFVY
jgi:protein-S-isoprenylcysteine O-methyltransferase Ste14